MIKASPVTPPRLPGFVRDSPLFGSGARGREPNVLPADQTSQGAMVAYEAKVGDPTSRVCSICRNVKSTLNGVRVCGECDRLPDSRVPAGV